MISVLYLECPLFGGSTVSMSIYITLCLQNGTVIEEHYEEYLKASTLNITSLNFYQQCYDATWTMARALNSTLNGNF